MSEAEITRLRRDVEVIQQAAGLTLPFGWREVWLALGMIPCGLIILLWAAVGPWDAIFFSLIPLGLFALVVAGVQTSQYRRDGQTRHLQSEWIITGIAVLAFAGLILWEKWLKLPAMPVRGAAFIIAGAMCLAVALSSRQRRVYLALTVALVPFGIAVPLCSPQQRALVGGVAVMVAGIVTAAIMAGQLRAERRDRERATH